MFTFKEIITPEILGYVWQITDRRYYDNGSDASMEFANVVPLDPETLEPVTVVKIGRVTREAYNATQITFTASYRVYWNEPDKTYISMDTPYNVEELTDKAKELLKDSLTPYLEEFAKPLTEEEKFEQFAGRLQEWLPWHLKQALVEQAGVRSFNYGKRTKEQKARLQKIINNSLKGLMDTPL